MNPFATPDRIWVYDRPQDMRAGVDRLSQVAAAGMGMSPADGSLFVFIGRDRRRLKMLRHDSGAWCVWYVRLARGRLRWTWGAGDSPARALERRELLWLLEGLEPGRAPAPGVVATRVI